MKLFICGIGVFFFLNSLSIKASFSYENGESLELSGVLKSSISEGPLYLKNSDVHLTIIKNQEVISDLTQIELKYFSSSDNLIEMYKRNIDAFALFCLADALKNSCETILNIPDSLHPFVKTIEMGLFDPAQTPVGNVLKIETSASLDWFSERTPKSDLMTETTQLSDVANNRGPFTLPAAHSLEVHFKNQGAFPTEKKFKVSAVGLNRSRQIIFSDAVSFEDTVLPGEEQMVALTQKMRASTWDQLCELNITLDPDGVIPEKFKINNSKTIKAGHCANVTNELDLAIFAETNEGQLNLHFINLAHGNIFAPLHAEIQELNAAGLVLNTIKKGISENLLGIGEEAMTTIYGLHPEACRWRITADPDFYINDLNRQNNFFEINNCQKRGSNK